MIWWTLAVCGAVGVLGFVIGFVREARRDLRENPKTRDDFRWFFRTWGGRRSD